MVCGGKIKDPRSPYKTFHVFDDGPHVVAFETFLTDRLLLYRYSADMSRKTNENYYYKEEDTEEDVGCSLAHAK